MSAFDVTAVTPVPAHEVGLPGDPHLTDVAWKATVAQRGRSTPELRISGSNAVLPQFACWTSPSPQNPDWRGRRAPGHGVSSAARLQALSSPPPGFSGDVTSLPVTQREVSRHSRMEAVPPRASHRCFQRHTAPLQGHPGGEPRWGSEFEQTPCWF